MNNNDNKDPKIESFFEDTEFYEQETLNLTPNEDESNNSIDNPQIHKLSKKRKILIIVGITITVLFLIYFIGIFYFSNRFVPGTYINGIDVGGQTNQEAVNTINNRLLDRSVTIIGENNETNQVNGAEVGLRFIDIKGLQSLIRSQNLFLWPFDFIIKSNNDFTTAYSLDQKTLESTIDNLSLVNGINVIEPKNATFIYNGSEFSIESAQPGTKPNKVKLEKAVEEALVDNIPTINLAQDDLYEQPEYTQDSPLMKSNLEKLNKAIQAKITINFPNSPYEINKDTFNTWLIANNNGVSLNQDELDNFVTNLANQFNTANRVYSFKAHNGTNYTFRNDKFGFILNQPQEVDTLNQEILNGETKSENPIWSQSTGGYINGNQITNSYIEISLKDQMIWIYKNNTLIGSSTIVSGNVASNQATQTGLFYIQSKNINTNMVVRLPDGRTLNQQVNYWFPYYNTIGIESASWRTQFGGQIYLNQGTDGDIDIPVDMGQTLNNNIDPGYPVVVY